MQAFTYFLTVAVLVAHALALPISFSTISALPTTPVSAISETTVIFISIPTTSTAQPFVTSGAPGTGMVAAAAADPVPSANSLRDTDTATRRLLLSYITSFRDLIEHGGMGSVRTKMPRFRGEVDRVVARYVAVRGRATHMGLLNAPLGGEPAGEIAVEFDMHTLERDVEDDAGARKLLGDLERVQEQILWLLDDHDILERLVHSQAPAMVNVSASLIEASAISSTSTSTTRARMSATPAKISAKHISTLHAPARSSSPTATPARARVSASARIPIVTSVSHKSSPKPTHTSSRPSPTASHAPVKVYASASARVSVSVSAKVVVRTSIRTPKVPTASPIPSLRGAPVHL